MITLDRIRKTYGSVGQETVALDDVSLTIEQGEIFGMIGRSGAGKSTLIRLLNLLERPTAGQVVLDGQCISELDESSLRRVRHKIGMVFQHFNLLQSRTVLDNVCFPLKLAGQPRAKQVERAMEVLTLVGLQAHANKYPRQLSGGQQQRVGIARALANEPRLLLCDEATSALDPETTQSILELLVQINQKLGLTIVLITHSMDVIRQICHRVAVIEYGVLVEQGAVLDVLLRPAHPVTQSLLSQSSTEEQTWRQLIELQDSGVALRLRYQGQTATMPLISQLSRDLGVDISILQGAVGMMGTTPYGHLIVYATGTSEQLTQLKATLKTLEIDFEELQP
ncbi:methionine ABC transporter ATP-binding protein [Orrella sp. 11846]|uniref:methionine ABC transporter ATP-binding protein n=1 Tax=Orrella sp. 11846 TaxID=3409913 RepID=UPI003B5AB1F6